MSAINCFLPWSTSPIDTSGLLATNQTTHPQKELSFHELAGVRVRNIRSLADPSDQEFQFISRYLVVLFISTRYIHHFNLRASRSWHNPTDVCARYDATNEEYSPVTVDLQFIASLCLASSLRVLLYSSRSGSSPWQVCVAATAVSLAYTGSGST